MDDGAVVRLRNALEGIHGDGTTRDRLFNVWVSYLIPLLPQVFPRGQGERFEMLRSDITTVEDPVSGSIKATLDAMSDVELVEHVAMLSSFIVDVLRASGEKLQPLS